MPRATSRSASLLREQQCSRRFGPSTFLLSEAHLLSRPGRPHHQKRGREGAPPGTTGGAHRIFSASNSTPHSLRHSPALGVILLTISHLFVALVLPWPSTCWLCYPPRASLALHLEACLILPSCPTQTSHPAHLPAPGLVGVAITLPILTGPAI